MVDEIEDLREGGLGVWRKETKKRERDCWSLLVQLKNPKGGRNMGTRENAVVSRPGFPFFSFFL